MSAEGISKMCLGKSRYGTEHRANRAKEKAREARGVFLRAYSCPICFFWHLTKVDVVQPKPTPAQAAAYGPFLGCGECEQKVYALRRIICKGDPECGRVLPASKVALDKTWSTAWCPRRAS